MFKKEKGFTLVETLITIFIFVLAIGLVTAFIVFSYRSQRYNWQQAQAIDEARRGIDTMISELREARMGEDGSYIIEEANGYEIIFYSDIDKDGEIERIRYFIYQNGSESNDCTAYSRGGSCSVNFSDFSSNGLDSADIEICVEGDLDDGSEYVDITADGQVLGRLCSSGCNQCNEDWEGCQSFDVTDLAEDGSISFVADSSWDTGGWFGGFCDWQEANHSMKASFDFSWAESNNEASVTLKKGIINPVGQPPSYPEDQEEIIVLSRYIRNTLPLFRYYDGEGDELAAPARLEETKMIKVGLVINIDPDHPPFDFELESYVQIRNLKDNL